MRSAWPTIMTEPCNHQQAQARYDSSEYAGPMALRQDTSVGRLILVDLSAG